MHTLHFTQANTSDHTDEQLRRANEIMNLQDAASQCDVDAYEFTLEVALLAAE